VPADLPVTPRLVSKLTDGRASRYEPAFTRDGRALIVVSEVGGVANLERVDLSDSSVTTTLTQVTGAAVAPEPAPDGGIYFLTLHAKGYDLRRLAPDSARAVRVAALDARLTPVVARPLAPADTPAVRAVGPARRYGVGPRRFRIIPTTVGVQVVSPFTSSPFRDRGEIFVGLGVASADPVGRLSWIAQGVVAPRGPWRGGSLDAVWRGTRPAIFGSVFYAEQAPSRTNSDYAGFERFVDIRYAGATIGATLVRQLQPLRVQSLRLGLSAGRQSLGDTPYASRQLLFAAYAGAFAPRAGRGPTAEVALDAATGSWRDSSWTRGLARVALSTAVFGRRVFADGLIAGVSDDAPFSERLLFGGLPSPLTDPSVLSQRIAVPALPVGALGRDRGGMVRLGTRVGPWRPYYAEIYTPHAGRDFLGFYGIEQTARTPAIPFLRLPGTRAVGGVAMTADENAPWRRLRGYLFVQASP